MLNWDQVFFSAVILQNQYGDIPAALSFHGSDLHVSPQGQTLQPQCTQWHVSWCLCAAQSHVVMWECRQLAIPHQFSQKKKISNIGVFPGAPVPLLGLLHLWHKATAVAPPLNSLAIDMVINQLRSSYHWCCSQVFELVLLSNEARILTSLFIVRQPQTQSSRIRHDFRPGWKWHLFFTFALWFIDFQWPQSHSIYGCISHD